MHGDDGIFCDAIFCMLMSLFELMFVLCRSVTDRRRGDVDVIDDLFGVNTSVVRAEPLILEPRR